MSVHDRLGPKNSRGYPSKQSFGLSKTEEMDMPWKHDKFIPDSNQKYSVLVENLHPSATIDDIKASFAHLGNIINADYNLAVIDGNHVGSCVLSFDRNQAVQAAIKEFDQKLADVSRVSAVKSILGASSGSRSSQGKMYSDRLGVSKKASIKSNNNRLGGLVHHAAKKAAISTRLGAGNVSSRLGPASQTVRFNKNSLS